MGYKPSTSLVKPFKLRFGITVALRSLNAMAKRFSRTARTYRAKTTPKGGLLIMVSGVRLSDGAPNKYNPNELLFGYATKHRVEFIILLGVLFLILIIKKNYDNKIIQIIPTIIIAKAIMFFIVLFKYNLFLSVTRS